MHPLTNNYRNSTDVIAGPVIVSALLFFAILANFIIRGMFPIFLPVILPFSPSPYHVVQEL